MSPHTSQPIERSVIMVIGHSLILEPALFVPDKFHYSGEALITKSNASLWRSFVEEDNTLRRVNVGTLSAGCKCAAEVPLSKVINV